MKKFIFMLVALLGLFFSTQAQIKPSQMSTATVTAFRTKLEVLTQTESDARYPLKSDTITASSILVLKADSSATAGKKYATGKMLKDGLDLKANLSSPALTGTPTAPTATVGTNTTQIATTAGVLSEIAASDANTLKQLKSMYGWEGVAIPAFTTFSAFANDYTLTSARNYFITFIINKPTVVTGYIFNLITPGVYTPDAENGFSIHSMGTTTTTEVAGTKTLSSTVWSSSAGKVKLALASPVTLQPGEYKLWCMYHTSAQTTAPKVIGYTAYQGFFSSTNMFGGANAICGYLVSQTTLASPITINLSANSPGVPFIWLY